MKSYRKPRIQPAPNEGRSKADTIRDTIDLIGNEASQEMIQLLKRKAQQADSEAGEIERDHDSYLLVIR